MANNIEKATGAFLALKIIHMALGIGMIIFAIVAAIVQQQALMPEADESLARILQVVCVIATVAALVIGFNIFKRKMMAARNSPESGESRMAKYRSACILWWAMIEAPGLLATICYMLTGNIAFMALSILHIVIMLAFMPRKDNIIVLLNLTAAEVAKLDGEA